MELIEQSHEIIRMDNNALELIEMAGRTCYKSESLINEDSSKKFVKMIIDKGHHSVIEHAYMTIKFITNRGVTHELVRHRLANYSQESTRYVNYKNKDMQFILPVWMEKRYLRDYKKNPFRSDGNVFVTFNGDGDFINSCIKSEIRYNELIKKGWRPEQAREVLPNSLKTEIVMTANFREWMHVFNLRTSKQAHPQIRDLMRRCLADVKSKVPVVFDDISVDFIKGEFQY